MKQGALTARKFGTRIQVDGFMNRTLCVAPIILNAIVSNPIQCKAHLGALCEVPEDTCESYMQFCFSALRL